MAQAGGSHRAFYESRPTRTKVGPRVVSDVLGAPAVSGFCPRVGPGSSVSQGDTLIGFRNSSSRGTP